MVTLALLLTLSLHPVVQVGVHTLLRVASHGRKETGLEELRPHREHALVPVGALVPDQVVRRSCPDPGPLLQWPLLLTRHSLLGSPLAVHVSSGSLLSAPTHGPSLLNPGCTLRPRALRFLLEASGALPGHLAWSSEAGLK